jgi:hypothetical protein
MTHFGTKTSDAYKQLAWRDEQIYDLFATPCDKMQAVREPDGTTLLDNSLIVIESSLRTGHTRRNLPILFAGGGGRNPAGPTPSLRRRRDPDRQSVAQHVET